MFYTLRNLGGDSRQICRSSPVVQRLVAMVLDVVENDLMTVSSSLKRLVKFLTNDSDLSARRVALL